MNQKTHSLLTLSLVVVRSMGWQCLCIRAQASPRSVNACFTRRAGRECCRAPRMMRDWMLTRSSRRRMSLIWRRRLSWTSCIPRLRVRLVLLRELIAQEGSANLLVLALVASCKLVWYVGLWWLERRERVERKGFLVTLLLGLRKINMSFARDAIWGGTGKVLCPKITCWLKESLLSVWVLVQLKGVCEPKVDVDLAACIASCCSY